MAPNDRYFIDRFNKDLEALTRGKSTPSRSGHADQIAAARRLRALDASQGAPPGLADRIWDELMNQAGLPGAPTLPPAGSASRPALNGKSAPHPWRAAAKAPVDLDSRRWTIGQFAAAAILVLTLVASVIALRATTPETSLTLVEAPQKPAVETFLDTTIESAAEVWLPMSVERWTFQPGSATLTIPPLDGPQWIAADGGDLVATVAGEERNLAAGNGLVVTAGQDLALRNPGQGAVAALRGVAGMTFSLEEYDRGAIAMEVVLDTESHEALPPGASRVVLERLTLEPGASLAMEPRAGQDLIDVVSGLLGLTLVGDGLPQGWRSGREREVGPPDLLPAMVPGTRVTVSNIGEEPLVLLRLRVLPLPETGS
jgi:hypothetical protein